VVGLRKTFGDKVVLDGLDFEVPRGTVFSLLGPNGAGKTTTVQILSTLIGADGGQARVAGCDVARDPDGVRRAIGVTGQYSAVDGLLTGRENLILMADLYRLGRAEGRRRADELLERFDLVEAGGKLASTYSGGMRRKLDIAMTLVGDPQIIFLDEPTTGLDPRSRRAMWDLARALVAAGVTIFLTTQYLEEADVLADRVGIIDRGKIVAEGTPAELKASIGRPSVEAVPADPAERDRLAVVLRRFGEAAAASSNAIAARLPEGVGDLAEIVRTLDAEGLRVSDLRLHTPSLDDVFLAKTGRSLEGAGDEQDDEGTTGEQPAVDGDGAPARPSAGAPAGRS
jgi:ABC-2 type transport system ATP-binding protein